MQNDTVYVLFPGRSAMQANAFVASWLKGPKPATETFSFPRFADTPLAIVDSPEQVMHLLECHSSEPYELCWNEDAADSRLLPYRISSVFIDFTNDGKMIGGCALAYGDPRPVLVRACELVGAVYGIVLGEQPPPDSAAEFISLCERAEFPRIVAGEPRGWDTEC